VIEELEEMEELTLFHLVDKEFVIILNTVILLEEDLVEEQILYFTMFKWSSYK
jgi:hypothetical protein